MSNAPSEPSAASDDPSGVRALPQGGRRRLLLVGNPNVGKSVLFGKLTGTYVTVSNYPGTTVEVTRGHGWIGDVERGETWDVVDTPGTNNLVPMSDDEAVTRTILFRERHDAIIQVGDAKALSRVILLALQLRELGQPFSLALNMFDELRARGLRIDCARLSARLGVPVYPVAALIDEGVQSLREGVGRDASAGAAHAALEGSASVTATVDDATVTPIEAELPEPLERAIGAFAVEIANLVEPSALVVGARAVAIALISGDDAVLEPAHPALIERAAALRAELQSTFGMPAFAVLNRARLAAAGRVAREVVQKVDVALESGARVGTARAALFAGVVGVVGGLIVDGAAALARTAPAGGDALASYGVGAIVSRAFSRAALTGWTRPGLGFLAVAAVLGFFVARGAARLRVAAWKVLGAWCAGYTAFWLAAALEQLMTGRTAAVPVAIGAGVAAIGLALAARSAPSDDLRFTQRLGALTMRPVAGLPFLAAALLIAYQVVGAFGAGTAVDYLENDVFGSAYASVTLDGPRASAPENADEGARRLVVAPLGDGRFDVRGEVKQGGAFVADVDARITAGRAAIASIEPGHFVVTTPPGASAIAVKAWSGHLNRYAQRGLDRIGWRWMTDFFVGPYGLLTMGLTYAIAIVLPVVATFFFVFSILEDSGYLPRLAVMANRGMRVIGLNGKAVLPMILGLGCDTMATLTARVLESKKERVLTTFLLALAIPCSSQLTVVFALMQTVSWRASALWLLAMTLTLLIVGWTAARVVPGDRSDFVLEIPPIRRPELRNVATKTLARIEWYLKEAVPLFLVGSLLLYFLDQLHLLPWVHRAGEPIVHHVLGFPRGGDVAPKVSEALLVGFLRRDFGAAGLLDLARRGALSPADVAVSMVVITLFIPCIANVFMIVKERGWKTAAAMAGFIFPYALGVGALVRRVMGH